MARVIIQPQTADNLKNLIKSAVENQLRVISFGIAKTKGNCKKIEYPSEYSPEETQTA